MGSVVEAQVMVTAVADEGGGAVWSVAVGSQVRRASCAAQPWLPRGGWPSRDHLGAADLAWHQPALAIDALRMEALQLFSHLGHVFVPRCSLRLPTVRHLLVHGNAPPPHLV